MQYKKIYFVGIKGVGMASLAIIAKEAFRSFDFAQDSGQAGFEIAGSDIKEEFITDEVLKKNQIYPLVGFSTQNLDTFVGNSKKEEVLVTSTSAHGGFENIETRHARSHGFRVLTHGQAVGEFMKGSIFDRGDIEGISVAGTHGKTTISAMLATVFTKLGFDPSYTVGTSEIFPIGNAGHYGKGRYFIAEADEYVSEINFDRIPKFLYQHPKVAIINNIDFDHPDFFKDIQEIEDAFYQFAMGVDSNGMLIFNGDDTRANVIKKKLGNKKHTITFGSTPSNDFFVSSYTQKGFSGTFSVEAKGVNLGEFNLAVPGYHNAKNALPVIALLLEYGIPIKQIKQVLENFCGTKRRMEIKGNTEKGVVVIDDYAHHPREIKTTLSTIKMAYPEKKIVCVFQPHTYSRTIALFSDFVSSFYDASQVIVLPIYASLREAHVSNFSAERFIGEFGKINKEAHFLKEPGFVVEYINKIAKDDYIVVTMGAGDVYKIGERMLAK